jgi:hypothetical protein
MTGAPTSAGAPGDPADDDERPAPNVVQISTYNPPPGSDLGIRSQMAYGGPVVFARRAHPWRVLLLVVVIAGLLGVGGTWVYRAVQRAQHHTTSDQTISTATLAPSTTATAAPATATPATLPPTGSLFDVAAAALIPPAVEAAAPGDPSAFTSIAIYPAYAVATVRDPANPARTVRVTVRGAQVVADQPLTQAVDVTPSLFAMSDVNWSVLAPLVAGAPAAANAPADVVDHVVVQRWGFDPAYPMRVLVYLSGGTLIEAGVDGKVIAVHPNA